MIQFMRDKDGNLYAVRDGQVIGQVEGMGDKQKEQEEEKNGTRNRSDDRQPRR